MKAGTWKAMKHKSNEFVRSSNARDVAKGEIWVEEIEGTEGGW